MIIPSEEEEEEEEEEAGVSFVKSTTVAYVGA